MTTAAMQTAPVSARRAQNLAMMMNLPVYPNSRERRLCPNSRIVARRRLDFTKSLTKFC
jgi:hypothetical protein